MIQISKKYGYIKSGLCHQRIDNRRDRAQGSRMAWIDCKDDPKYIKKFKTTSKYQILKVSPSRGFGKYGGSYQEIGYLRMLQNVFPQLFKKKIRFTKKHMNNWIEGIASAEFGASMESPLSIINPKEKCSFGLLPPKPNDDAIYQKKYGIKKGIIKHLSE